MLVARTRAEVASGGIPCSRNCVFFQSSRVRTERRVSLQSSLSNNSQVCDPKMSELLSQGNFDDLALKEMLIPTSAQQELVQEHLSAKMPTRKLGRTGLDVSIISFGSWVSFDYQLDVAKAKELIAACFKGGINFFDAAEVYAHGKAEMIMGQALKELDIPRCDIVISTKVFHGCTKEPTKTARGLSRKHVVEGVKACLKRLQLEYVDVLFAHRPDPSTPIEETVRAFNWCIEQGMAFYWGTSEWSTSQILEAQRVADRLGLLGPVAEQTHYNLLHRKRVEEDLCPLFDQYGLGLTTFSPLACGILSGKYAGGQVPTESRFAVPRYQNLKEGLLKEENLKAAEALKPLADEMGVSSAQLALAWCMSNKNVSTVISGATKVSQVEENLRAVRLVPLSESMMTKIEHQLGSHSCNILDRF